MEQRSKNSISDFLKKAAAGFLIGLGGILPGVSGGVIAVSFGLYELILDALYGVFRHLKKSILFLLPVGLGALLGFFCGTKFIAEYFDRYYVEVMYLFLGLVAGGVPSFIAEANSGGFKKRYLIATVFGAVAASTLLFLERDVSGHSPDAVLTPVAAMISGAILAAGTIIPGISTSFVLIYLGWYQPAMNALTELHIGTLLFIGIGIVLCALALIKGVRWLFSRFHGWTYYGVLGFLIVSAVLIFPGFAFTSEYIIGIVLFAVGFLTAYLFGRIQTGEKT